MSLIPVSGVVDVPSLSPELGFWLEMADHIPEARTFDGLEWDPPEEKIAKPLFGVDGRDAGRFFHTDLKGGLIGWRRPIDCAM